MTAETKAEHFFRAIIRTERKGQLAFALPAHNLGHAKGD
jgi:hypothetical protein